MAYQVVCIMPTFLIPIHQHPRICYHPRIHHLRDQQAKENYYRKLRERMMRKSTCQFSKNNILKLNTDGSSKGNPGPSSFGGLIRDGNGRWLCGYMGKMKGRSYTSLEAEVWSVYRGLCLIKGMNLSNMLIETDCESILRMGFGSLDKDHPLRVIMDNIDKMLLEQKCCMIHTRRDGNHCADQLAKLGGRQSEEYVVLEEPPTVVIPYLLRDESRFRV